MGAKTVRIGFEDSNYMDENQYADHNYQLVERLVTLVKAMGLSPATPDETRKIMGTLPK